MNVVRYMADMVVFAHYDQPLYTSILLIQRRWEPWKHAWALPGGEVEPAETGEQAARRELEEETGIALDPAGQPVKFVGLYDAPDRDPRGRVISVAFRSELDSRVVPTARDDAEQAEWVPLSEVWSGRVSLAFDHLQIVRDAIGAIERDDATA